MISDFGIYVDSITIQYQEPGNGVGTIKFDDLEKHEIAKRELIADFIVVDEEYDDVVSI